MNNERGIRLNDDPYVRAKAELEYRTSEFEKRTKSIAARRAELEEQGQVLELAAYKNQTMRQSALDRNARGARLREEMDQWQADMQALEADERSLKDHEREVAQLQHQLSVLDYRRMKHEKETAWDNFITERFSFGDHFADPRDQIAVGRQHIAAHEEAFRFLEAAKRGDVSAVKSMNAPTFPLETRVQDRYGRHWLAVTDENLYTFITPDTTTGADARLGNGGESE